MVLISITSLLPSAFQSALTLWRLRIRKENNFLFLSGLLDAHWFPFFFFFFFYFKWKWKLCNISLQVQIKRVFIGSTNFFSSYTGKEKWNQEKDFYFVKAFTRFIKVNIRTMTLLNISSSIFLCPSLSLDLPF